nr:hypothetical protein Hi04_10k_c3807_00028 [uncultured bacterium]
MTFDNCGRAGLCDAGPEPAITKPDAGTSSPSTPLDGGPALNCYDSVDRPNVIFMNGSTNFTPFVVAMVPIVAQSGFVIVWQPTSSCTGADTAFNSDATRRVMKNPTNSSQNWPSFYTVSNVPSGTQCQLGGSPAAMAAGLPAGQEIVDIGESDIFATSCPVTNAAVSPFDQYVPGSMAYPAVRHFGGPIQSMVFVTPPDSSQRVISAEAARIVFGLGGNASSSAEVQPWVDPAFMWIRSSTTGTTGIISRGIGVPPTDFWGIDQKSASNMVTQIKSVSSANAEKTLGLLSMDFADKEKNNLHVLYFQPRGALAGFLADLHPFTKDKQNLRDGHYPLWGPIHLYVHELSGGGISNGATAFVTQFSVPEPDTQLLNATIATGNVPVCAMKVMRDFEMGPLHSYTPQFQCYCYFEKQVGAGAECHACNGPGDCAAPTPACNLGYCEAQ